MSEKETREQLAKLRALVAIKDAQVMANPKLYLEDMARMCQELLDVLEAVDRALSPAVVFDYWEENADKDAISSPGDIQGEALIRCNKAREAIRQYRAKESRDE